MTDKKRDLLCSVIFLAFGIFMFVQSAAIKPLMGSKDLGSGFVPKIIAGCIIVIAAAKLIMTLTSKKEEKKIENDEDKMGGLLTIALLLIYSVLFNTLGFILSTMLYLFAQMLILSDERNRKIPLFAVIAVVAPVAIYGLFVYVIKMPLPIGLFGF